MPAVVTISSRTDNPPAVFAIVPPVVVMVPLCAERSPLAVRFVVPIVPVEGFQVSFVLETFCGRLPVFAVTQVGYIVAFVVVSFVIPVLTAFVAVPAVRLDAVPVALVNTIADGVPASPLNKIGAPALPTFTPNAVAMPVPRPETPLEIGNPDALVSVKDDGVPPAPLNTTNAPALPVLTPSAVKTPVPVVIVLGAVPAPPPMTSALAASAPLEAQVVPLEKYGMPPLVPATVKASVPEVVIGEPPTEIRPPVKLCATLVTVPPLAALADHLIPFVEAASAVRT